jgi:hypothetical protein
LNSPRDRLAQWRQANPNAATDLIFAVWLTLNADGGDYERGVRPVGHRMFCAVRASHQEVTAKGASLPRWEEAVESTRRSGIAPDHLAELITASPWAYRKHGDPVGLSPDAREAHQLPEVPQALRDPACPPDGSQQNSSVGFGVGFLIDV